MTLAGILFTELGQSICPIEWLSENLAVRFLWVLSTSTALDVPNNKVNSSSSPETFLGVGDLLYNWQCLEVNSALRRDRHYRQCSGHQRIELRLATWETKTIPDVSLWPRKLRKK